ncbi:hypothetical protein BD560DRAFT_429377 [Blakeslea trispora]|nr:hypothetical protein BD560DRAFT_429377 [Blakeslea trispora]
MIHWGHSKHFICPVHSSDRRVPTNSGPAVDLQWDSTITFVQRTPNCCTNNRRPPLNLAAVDVLLGVVLASKGSMSRCCSLVWLVVLFFGILLWLSLKLITDSLILVTYWGDIKLSIVSTSLAEKFRSSNFLAVIFPLLKILKQPDFLNAEEFEMSCHFFFKKYQDLKSLLKKLENTFGNEKIEKLRTRLTK